MSVNSNDIAVALGRTASSVTQVEEDQWDMWVSDALMLISARLGDLDELDADRLDYVVREAVVSHIRKPDDATQVEVAIDDARSSRTYRTSKGRVTILDDWWDLLSPSQSTYGAFSISPSSYCASHVSWCSHMLGASYCSCGVDIAGHPIFESDDA